MSTLNQPIHKNIKKEIRIGIIGSVDSGKSSTIGVLKSGILEHKFILNLTILRDYYHYLHSVKLVIKK